MNGSTQKRDYDLKSNLREWQKFKAQERRLLARMTNDEKIAYYRKHQGMSGLVCGHFR